MVWTRIRGAKRTAGWLILALLLVLAGCSDDDGPTTPLLASPEPPPSPGEVALWLKSAYEDLDLDPLDDSILHEDFRMIPTPALRMEWGWSDDYVFDRATFLAMHEHMFDGLPGEDSHGNTIHPIASIEVDLFEQQAGWLDIPIADEYFGGAEGGYAPYRVTLEFYDANLSHRFLVQQIVNVYVAPVTLNGTAGYQLLGLRGEQPKDSATDSASWAGVLSLFRASDASDG